MSTAEQTATPAPAELPATVAAWLLAGLAEHDNDTRLSVEIWTSPELVATRGPWKLWITADGQNAGLDLDSGAGASLADLGQAWPYHLAELAALLSDPRVAEQIAAAHAARTAAILGPIALTPEGGR